MVMVEKDKFASIIVMGNDGEEVRIQEEDKIVFTTESGVTKKAVLTKITGSKKERKLQIRPMFSEFEEVWSLFNIQEGTLRVMTKEDVEDEE